MCFAIKDVPLKSLAGPGTVYLLQCFAVSYAICVHGRRQASAQLGPSAHHRTLAVYLADARHHLAALLTLTWLQLVQVQSGSTMGLFAECCLVSCLHRCDSWARPTQRIRHPTQQISLYKCEWESAPCLPCLQTLIPMFLSVLPVSSKEVVPCLRQRFINVWWMHLLLKLRFAQ